MPKNAPALDAMEKNVRLITRLEQLSLNSRTAADRVADIITHFSGTNIFVILHVIWFAVWVAMNSGFVSRLKPFDPFPFPFLTLIVSLEAIFLSTFVLITQNRMQRQADRRAHLDLQINLLAEQETTKVLQLLKAMSDHLGIKAKEHESGMEGLEEETNILKLVRSLEGKLDVAGK
jgi:uncharacterized membrane protein